MTYESLRALVRATMRHAIEQSADGNAVAERDTDAGTVDPFPDTVIDDRPYDEEIREYDDDR